METLKKCRNLKGLTQIEVAKLLNISNSTYSGYETGKSNPDIFMLKKIAKLYNVSADYLLELTDNPTPVVYREQTTDYYFSTNYPNFAKLSEEEKKAVIEETKALAERLTSFFEKQGKK